MGETEGAAGGGPSSGPVMGGDWWSVRKDPLDFFYECVGVAQIALLEKMKEEPNLQITFQGHPAPHMVAKYVLWSVWEKLGQKENWPVVHYPYGDGHPFPVA